MADVAQLLRDYIAQQALEQGGSIMAKPEKPQWRKDSPLLDAIMSSIDQLLKVASPVENVSGPQEAILGPIGRTASKYVNQAQKHVAKGIFRADPSQLAAVVENPRMLNITTPTQPGLSAMLQAGAYPRQALATYRGSETMPLGTLTISPTTLQGLSSSGVREMDPRAINVPEVALHEVQHFLNEPRLYTDISAAGKVHPQGAALFDLLKPYINPIARRAAVRGAANSLNPTIAADEALAYLSGAGSRNPSTEDIGKLLYEKLKNIPGQPQQPLSVTGVGSAIEAAKQEAPSNQSMLDYITKTLFGGQ